MSPGQGWGCRGNGRRRGRERGRARRVRAANTLESKVPDERWGAGDAGLRAHEDHRSTSRRCPCGRRAAHAARLAASTARWPSPRLSVRELGSSIGVLSEAWVDACNEATASNAEGTAPTSVSSAASSTTASNRRQRRGPRGRRAGRAAARRPPGLRSRCRWHRGGRASDAGGELGGSPRPETRPGLEPLWWMGARRSTTCPCAATKSRARRRPRRSPSRAVGHRGASGRGRKVDLHRRRGAYREPVEGGAGTSVGGSPLRGARSQGLPVSMGLEERAPARTADDGALRSGTLPRGREAPPEGGQAALVVLVPLDDRAGSSR